MLRDPKTELSNIFAFALGVSSIEGTVIERRIIEAVEGGSSKNMLYKPRSGGMNKNRGRYNDVQMDYIMNHCAEPLSVFGYTNDPLGYENDYCFFDYGKSNPYESKFELFKQLNKEMLEHISKNRNMME